MAWGPFGEKSIFHFCLFFVKLLRRIFLSLDGKAVMKNSILLVEDDETIQTLVRLSLREYHVTVVSKISEARRFLQEKKFEALLIDIGLPDGDGLRFLGELASQGDQDVLPVLVISNRDDLSSKSAAFSFGAEDYLCKPFDPLELQIRLDSKIKKHRKLANHEGVRNYGNVTLDLNRYKAYLNRTNFQEDLNLTTLELKILKLLTHRLEQVYTREQILENVWGQTTISDRTIDSHIAHLRAKLKSTDLVVETAKNIGYLARLRNV